MRTIQATRPVMPSYEEYVKEIQSIWDTGAMTNNGPKLRELKERLKEYTDCSNIDLFVNGHSALYACLKLMNLEGEVLTSPFTFVSTTNAIVQAGLTPVFCDIDESYQLDSQKLEEHITEKTCAIVTPHIFGIPCDVDAIQKIADKHGLKVVYDAAQAFGTKVHGRDITSYGDATMVSFHAIKVFNAIEGGMLVYKDATLGNKIEKFRNFGINRETGEVELCGLNAKMDEFRAAMGLINLPHLEEEIEKREKIVAMYEDCLCDIKGVTPYKYLGDIRYNHGYYPVRIEKSKCGMSRDEIFDELQKHGIMTRKLYDRLTCDNAIYSGYKRDTAVADKIKDEMLDLPLYGTLTNEDVNYIGMMFHKILKC